MDSEFSYAPSEDLNTLGPDARHRSTGSHKSTSSKGSKSSKSSKTSRKDPFSDFHAPPTKHSARESYMSSVSEYSAREKDVAEPVTVTRVERDLGEVNRVDLQSESSIKLGKLPTVKGRPEQKLPDMSYNTNVEAPVPPRSSRRPKSGIYTAQDIDLPTKEKGHKPLHSITDDLEKLMASAASAGDLEPEYEGRDDSSSKYSHSRKTTDTTSPQFEYADRFLPPRPSPTDVERARVVSQEIRQGMGEKEIGEEREIGKRPEQPQFSSGQPQFRSEQPQLSSEQPQVSPGQSQFSSGQYEQVRSEQSEQTEQPEQPQFRPEQSKHFSPESKQFSPESEQFAPKHSDHFSPVTEGAVEWKHSGHPYRQSLSSTDPSVHYPPDDNDYYDIDEPVIVNPPARVKSVKDSTHNLNKGKKKTKKRVKSHASKSHLKPFTYSTLISLLESTNGTVIGEEFTQLNLPIRQKQLVERIVDSLSRLTLDMLVDEQRYEIGIRRLESALRVLEGFM